MKRDELEQLDRDALVAKAQQAGVARARVLTRPELVDELLLRSAVDFASKQRSRGLFGRARDLIARVVERGLHLPDAAERIRALGLPPPPRDSAPAALPTVTLAQIYAAQGHRERAVDTLNKVLVREPEHAVAASLLDKLRDRNYPVPPAALPPEDEGASAAPPPPPEDRGLDECLTAVVDAATLRVSWSVRAATFEHARRSHPSATLALCVRVVRPTWDGPRATVRCHEVASPDGTFLARDLPAGCVVRAAVGCLEGEIFVPFAHSPAHETPRPASADAPRGVPDGAVA